jgi:hypothetical protein
MLGAEHPLAHGESGAEFLLGSRSIDPYDLAIWRTGGSA